MTVQKLIEELQKIDDKKQVIWIEERELKTLGGKSQYFRTWRTPEAIQISKDGINIIPRY